MLTRRDLFFGKKRLRRDLSSDDGATATEYAIIAGVLGIVAVATWARFRRRRQASD